MAKVSAGSSSQPESQSGILDQIREFIRYTPDGSTIPAEQWRSRHRKLVAATLLHIPFLFALGVYSGTTPLAGAQIPVTPLPRVLLEVGIVFGLAAGSLTTRFRRRVRTILSVTAVFVSSVVLVQFSGGYIEAHFHFFVGMAMVAIYEDWLPFAWGLGYVVFTHGIFGSIDPSRVYNHTAAINNPWAWGLIHGGFVLMLSVSLMSHWYSTEKSREVAEDRLQQAETRATEIDDLEAKQAEIEEKREAAEEAQSNAEAKMEQVQEMNAKLQSQADRYSEVMQEAADGDLSVRVEADGNSEAMVQVGAAINEMLGEIEGTVREIQAFADEVAETSNTAVASSSEAQQASESVSESVQQIASVTDEQRAKLESTSEEMTSLSATIEEVAASAETVADVSNETAAVAEDGERTAEQAIQDSQTVQDAIDATVTQVESLDNQMEEIGQIIDVITEIAEQTNMLALNANIEAARASGQGDGADGGGFAVVADEVKQLAEETQDAASDVEALIDETREQTGATVQEAQRADEAMEQGIDAVENVVTAFSEVTENVAETDNGIQGISDTTEEQAASAEEVVSMIDVAVDSGQTMAAETENVSASAQQQAASMSEVSSAVESLRSEATELQALLSEFTVTDNDNPTT